MTYKLMIKTHTETKLKYLCITKKEKWETYSGSGVYWKKHLKKYGNTFTTELLYETDDYEEFVIQCLLASQFYDIVNSKEFANSIPEKGYDNIHESGYTNFELWWMYASEDLKNTTIKKRNASIKEHHWSTTESASDISKKISDASIMYWSQYTLDERRLMTQTIREKSKEFFNNKDSIEYQNYVEKQRRNTKLICANTPFEVLSERNRKHRLNMSDEAKEQRADKIREVYKTGKHDALFKKMSEDRMGVDNPAAKIIVWYDIEYTKSQFYKMLKLENIDKILAENLLNDENMPNCYKKYVDVVKEYPVDTCPYCGKTNKKTSSFLRWHFENCKNKKS